MENTDLLRIVFFVLALMLLTITEHYIPRRKILIPRKTRWLNNFSLILIGSVLIKILIPFSLAGIAIYAKENNIGLFNYSSFNFYITTILSFIILDFVIYCQHLLFHNIPIFWRLHKVHHIDQEIDVSTALRFHPIEILLSYILKSAAILLLGATLISVITFEIVLNVMAMFTHSNIRLPHHLDRFIRVILVTPDMHRVHHSNLEKETNSNFGFNFSFWDKIFKTYKSQPQEGHKKMSIGLKDFPDYKATNIKKLLLIPFIKQN